MNNGQSNPVKELAEQLKKPFGKKGLETGELMYQTNLSMIQSSFAKADIQDSDTVLEIGHGNGRHISEMLQHKKNIRYDGLEVSELMHREAVKNNSDSVGHFHFYLYDGNKIPLPDGRFNRIITANTIFFWNSPQDFLTELYRVLKSGGRLVISFGIREYLEEMPFAQYGFKLCSPEEFEDLIQKSSFRIISTELTREFVPSKTDDGQIERKFMTAVLEKRTD